MAKDHKENEIIFGQAAWPWLARSEFSGAGVKKIQKNENTL